MTEIVKAFREHVPAARLIGKRYSLAEEGAASHWGEWFENGWFLPLEMLGALKESEGAFYGFMVARGEEAREYWIGMLFPAGTQAPEGYESLDLPEGEAGICYLRAHEQDPTLYTMHEACVRALRQAGMEAPEGVGSAEQPVLCFERYNCPRFTTPDGEGRVILDYGVYLCAKGEWAQTAEGVWVRYGDRAVHIKTDAALVEYLGEAGNGARALAEEILREYEKRAGKPLDIGVDSLAIEILIHTFLDTFAGRALHLAEKLPGPLAEPLSALMNGLEDRTEIIDCGEREVDGNRWVFDRLAPFHGLFYEILGDKA